MAKELHFYPGQFPPTEVNVAGTGANRGPGLLIFLDGKTVLYRARAFGGPSKVIPDAGAPDFTPTPAGTFVLLGPEPYFTRSWVFSEIRWGTKLLDRPADPDVWYLVSSKLGKESWGSVKKDFGIARKEIQDYYWSLYGVRKVPKTWVFNAFGPVAVRFFKDQNKNRRLDGKERIEGAMLHTTAENEAEVSRKIALNMTNSHGCIHMKPPDRDALLGMGGLKAKLTLIIHHYHERF
jgi:hypothetical protein